MTKKQLSLIVFVILIIIVIIALLRFKEKRNATTTNVPSNGQVILKTNYDEETQLYYIKNDNGEIISASRNQEDLQFYLDHPDYNPNPLVPKSTNLEDYAYINEEE